MEPREISHEERCRVITVAVSIVAGVLLSVMTTGCSFKVETGWHGHTGRDDRTQSQLVRGGSSGEARGAVHEKY